jgi:hypothetical protein
MLPLFDAKWAKLTGGYRVPYDPSAALSRLEQGQDVWPELWNELHHQGDVGEDSDAAVPHLVRIAATAPQRCMNNSRGTSCTSQMEDPSQALRMVAHVGFGYRRELHNREESSVSLTRMMGAAALACGALAACATAPDAASGVACDRTHRVDAVQAGSPDATWTAGFAVAAVFPSRMLDAVLVTLATLSLGQQTEHDDDFLSAFGRRILNGRSPN